MRLTTILILTCLTFAGSGCSSSLWMVEDQRAIDRNDFELLDSEKFLVRTSSPTPENPTVTFQLKAANTFRYAQRVQTERYVQEYRPSFKSVAFGLLGAGIASTAALTIEQPTTSQNVLFGTAGFITLASVLNMKPKGTPTPTGESRLLRKTGTVQETDTVNVTLGDNFPPVYSLFYKSDVIVLEKEIPLRNSLYTINLLEELNPEEFEYDDDEQLLIEVYFNDTYYEVEIPLESVFEKFVVVSSEVTALRDEPVLNPRNVLTDLAFGSQMKLVAEDSLWYKVLYGISETWIAKTDANPIWRPSEFASQLSIITVPNVPFGNIDVENNIPVLAGNNDSTFAFILYNRAYQGEYSERIYAERDSRLIEQYFENGLSIPHTNIIKTNNIERQQQLVTAYNRLANAVRTDQKRLILYLSGYIKASENNDVLLVGTNPDGPSQDINLNTFFGGITGLPFEELIVFADLDNVEEARESGVLKKLGDSIISSKPKSAVIFGSSENQRSRNYTSVSGAQKRHSIFTYYVADALKKGQVDISGIVNHLQRNVDYTSRRLHNQPQNIIYFGNANLSLID